MTRLNSLPVFTPEQQRRIVDAVRRIEATPAPTSFGVTPPLYPSITVVKPVNDIKSNTSGPVKLETKDGDQTQEFDAYNPHAVTLAADKRCLAQAFEGWEQMILTPWEYTTCDLATGPIDGGGPP